MVYINKLKDRENFEDEFEEIIITKSYCADLIEECGSVYYSYLCDTDEDVEEIFDKLVEEMKHDKVNEKIINYIVGLGAEETSYIQDNGVIEFIYNVLDFYDERIEGTINTTIIMI